MGQVIEKGELVEYGTHEELINLQGRYHYLYGLQTDALSTDKLEVADVK